MTQFIKHEPDIAELPGSGILIADTETGTSLAGEVYYSGYDALILKEDQITPDFFDLKTGLAGEILQKFTNFRIRVALVGNFEKYRSESLQQFIAESNKHRQIVFVASVEKALAVLSA